MSIEAMKQAVENMEWSTPQGREAYWGLVKAIAEAEKQEPVAYVDKEMDGILRRAIIRSGKVITPQRTWVGLTEEEQLNVFAELIAKPRSEYEVYKAYELALKEKNT
jgi:hypothetical protein